MKFAILQCDSVQEKFRPQYDDYPQMIRQMFINAGFDFQSDVFDCRQQQYPDDINAYDFYITTGSKHSAYENIEWIKRLIKFVQALDQQQKKLIGICFGHQIIALAKGHKVEKSAKGWGVGIAQNTPFNTPNWAQPRLAKLNILASHQDQVLSLPPKAKLIASNALCPHFLVQWNAYFLSIQGHPEWHPDYSRDLMNDRKDRIPKDQIDQGLTSLNKPLDNIVFTKWIVHFVRQGRPAEH